MSSDKSLNIGGDFNDTNQWLSAFYALPKEKKLDKKSLSHIIYKNILQNVSLHYLESNLNYSFVHKKNLIRSLTQKTFALEIDPAFEVFSHNEQWEFVGDSLLNFMVAKKLLKLFPELSEGDLSKIRGALVNETSLAKLAEVLDLGRGLFLGRGEFLSGGKSKESLLANAFEAILAGIYYDSGQNMNVLEEVFEGIIEKYNRFVKKDFYSLEHLDIFDSKSKLQERSIALFGVYPSYKSAPHPYKPSEFLVELWIGGQKIAEKEGSSKRKLEKDLAHCALKELENSSVSILNK